MSRLCQISQELVYSVTEQTLSGYNPALEMVAVCHVIIQAFLNESIHRGV